MLCCTKYIEKVFVEVSSVAFPFDINKPGAKTSAATRASNKFSARPKLNDQNISNDG